MVLAPTQVSVTSEISGGASPSHLTFCLFAWLGAGAVVFVLCGFFGGEPGALAAAATIALSPALTGLILSRRLGERWARLLFIGDWALCAAMATAMTGGAASPVAAMLILAPAFALALGRAELIVFGTVASAAGYVLAALLGRDGGGDGLWAAPEMLATLSLFTCALIFIGVAQGGRRAARDAVTLRIAEAAHELRTPLNHIIGFADMIETQVFGPAEARYVEYAGLIKSAGRDLLDLIGRRLDLARIDSGRYALELESVDLAASVRDATALSAGSASQRAIVLDAAAPATPVLVRADAGAVRQILSNLIGNAIKFTPEGGRVRVETRAEDGWARLDVHDSGPGIPEADRARVVRPFERGARLGAEGSGLGLALVQALAQMHGGVLEISQSVLGGARVSVRLPQDGPQRAS